jgi:chorismate-pyruvate lyase
VSNPRPFERSILEDASLSLLQKALLVTDGTLTQLLEVFTGETIRVRKLGQSVGQGGPALLAVGADEPVISRRILLCGDRRAYLHAESWLVPARMPADLRDSMQATDTPIGQLWKAARLETFREIVDFRRETSPEISGLLGSGAGILARSYLVNTAGRPMSLIVERFPADLFT